MRTPLVAGNWKMYKGPTEARRLALEIRNGLLGTPRRRRSRPVPAVRQSGRGARRSCAARRSALGAQNVFWETSRRLDRRGRGRHAARRRLQLRPHRPLRTAAALRRDRRDGGAARARRARRRAASRSSASAKRWPSAKPAAPQARASKPRCARDSAARAGGLGRGDAGLRAGLGDRHRPERDPGAGPGGARVPARPGRGSMASQRVAEAAAHPVRRQRQAGQRRRSSWRSPTWTAPWSAARAWKPTAFLRIVDAADPAPASGTPPRPGATVHRLVFASPHRALAFPSPESPCSHSSWSFTFSFASP